MEQKPLGITRRFASTVFIVAVSAAFMLTPLTAQGEVLSISAVASHDFVLPFHLSYTTPDLLDPWTGVIVTLPDPLTTSVNTTFSFALSPDALPANAVVTQATVSWAAGAVSSNVIPVIPNITPIPPVLPLVVPVPAGIEFQQNVGGGLIRGYSFDGSSHEFTSISDLFGGSRVLYDRLVKPIGFDQSAQLAALLAGSPLTFGWEPSLAVTYDVLVAGISSTTIYDGIAAGTAHATFRLDVEYTLRDDQPPPNPDPTTPVPEPSSLLLTMFGGGAIVLRRSVWRG